MEQAATPRIEHVDVPAVGETFADSVHDMVFDGQVFRVELCVTRMQAANGSGASGKRYTACRIVLPAATALDLSQKLARVFSALLKQNAERKAAQEAAQPPA